jgi:hypothetical protein
MTVQSVIFDKNIFSKEDALKWIKDHLFKTNFGIDVKKDFIRVRQINPEYGDEYYFTKKVEPGVEYIIMSSRVSGYGFDMIPYKDALTKAEQIINEFKKKNVNLHIVGSIRRKEPYVEDIDFVTYDRLPNNAQWIRDIVTLNNKSVGVDIWKFKKENFILGSLLRSYPKHYIIALRKGLNENNPDYMLSDDELIYKQKPIKSSIKDIAKLAKVTYHPLEYYFY